MEAVIAAESAVGCVSGLATDVCIGLLEAEAAADHLLHDAEQQRVGDVVQKALEKKARKDAEWGQVEIEVRREVARYLHDETGIRPLILTQIELI